jgi:hypothetical protein
VAKSNRRRKQDRARAEARRADQARRRTRKDQDRAMMEHFARMANPQTPPEEVAELVTLELAGSPAGGAIARTRLHTGVPAEQVARTARLLLAAEERGIGALTFAAALAHELGDEDEEHRCTAEALARARAGGEDGGASTWVRVVRFIGSSHPGEAIELIEPYLAAEPDDALAGETYAAALEQLYQSADPSEGERAALDRYADRSALVALREAFGQFLDRTEWGELVARRVAGELAEATSLSPDERETFIELCSEIASMAVTRDGYHEDVAERDDRERESPLHAFAADPSVPPELAAVASAWNEHARYGLWQLADPAATPGVWCTDLVTGRRLYVQFPPEVLTGAPPWTVWLGAVVPASGVWRCAGTGCRLSPVEADAAAEYIDQAARMVAETFAGTPGDKLPEARPLRFGSAAPYGLRWEYTDPMPSAYAPIASLLTSGLTTRLVVDIARYRSAKPRIETTDGEPLIPIDATIAVRGDVTSRLLAHPDFSLEDDADPMRIVWWGRKVPPAEVDSMLAELRAEGYEPEIEDGKPRRWTRGKLTVAEGEIRAAVNSAGRLDRLLRILTKLDAAPIVTAEKLVDPGLDYLLLADSVMSVTGSALIVADGWEKTWLEEQVPVLRGRTPREAAISEGEDWIRLESLLRQFEYQAGLAALDGHRGIDVAWLREELDMPRARHHYDARMTSAALTGDMSHPRHSDVGD